MIVNKSQKRVLSGQEKVCCSLFSQALGLMFSPKKNLVMVFPSSRRVSLHNFFVFYPLTLVFIDSDQKVCEVKKNFLPFTLYRSKRSAKYLLETPFSAKVNVGDRLRFSF